VFVLNDYYAQNNKLYHLLNRQMIFTLKHSSSGLKNSPMLKL